MQGSSTRPSSASGSRPWRLGALLVGVLALLTLATLAVLAHGSPSTASSSQTPGTVTGPRDTVSVTGKNPSTSNPQNVVTVPTGIGTTINSNNTPVYTIGQDQTPPPPPVPIDQAVTRVAPTQAGGYCLPSDQQTFTVTAILTTHDTNGGVAKYVWVTSDGYHSPTQTVTFAKGQTSATVHDTWTLGAWFADGTTRWEAVKVLGTHPLTSNHATLVYTCAPEIYNTQVNAVELCDGTTWLVTAEVDVFAPAGGSITFNWSDTKNGEQLGQAQTVTMPAGYKGATLVARWHVGSAPVVGDGVSIIALNGQVLVTPEFIPVPQDDTSSDSGSQGSQDQQPTTGQVNICAATVTASPTSGTPGTAQPVTFTGAVSLNTNAGVSLMYYWQRSDGSQSTPVTTTVQPNDDTLTVTDTWTPPSSAGTYTDKLVLKQEDGSPLPVGTLTPNGEMILGTGSHVVGTPTDQSTDATPTDTPAPTDTNSNANSDVVIVTPSPTPDTTDTGTANGDSGSQTPTSDATNS